MLLHIGIDNPNLHGIIGVHV